MKRFPKILAATCAAIALSSSLALAAEPAKTEAPAPAPAGPHAGHGRAAMGHGPMMGALAQLPPEKQEAARALMDAHAKAMFPLHQGLYAKMAELEAANAAGEGDGARGKAAIRDISDLTSKMLQENAKFRTRMLKETGLRVPVMGHGMGHGGMGMGMMGGKGGCGMMGGQGAMMGGQGGQMGPMGGQMAMPGAAAPVAAPAPAAGAHSEHQN